MGKKQLNVKLIVLQSTIFIKHLTFNWFNALDHVFHINIIASCYQNWYVQPAIYILTQSL